MHPLFQHLHKNPKWTALRHSQMVNVAKHALSSNVFSPLFTQACKTITWILFIFAEYIFRHTVNIWTCRWLDLLCIGRWEKICKLPISLSWLQEGKKKKKKKKDEQNFCCLWTNFVNATMKKKKIQLLNFHFRVTSRKRKMTIRMLTIFSFIVNLGLRKFGLYSKTDHVSELNIETSCRCIMVGNWYLRYNKKVLWIIGSQRNPK